MGTVAQTARSRLHSLGERLVRRAAPRLGLELKEPGDGVVLAVPPGRTEPFKAGAYEVVPDGFFDVVRRDYYSPVPDLTRLPDDIWERRSPLGGVDLRLDAAIELVESELAPFIAEFDLPIDGPRPPGEFFLRNGNYEAVDAELLYGVVRARKPRRVLELGSGYTTLLIGAACRRNAEDGVATEHVAYDPFPRAQIIGEGPPPPTRFEPISATDVPIEAFRELEAGDVLFVDTTHTVKLGSDVNFIVLEVLPELAPGVIVHFHDIFIPWEYPRSWFEEMQYYWAEQYLLQAFLAYNEAFDVLLPGSALARDRAERMAAAIPSFFPEVRPGAFWLVRK